MAVVAVFGWVFNEYQEHKETRDKQLDIRIRKLIEEDTEHIISNIDTKTILFENIIDSLSNLIKNEEFYSVGWGTLGNGNWYFRELDGSIYKCFLNEERDMWYYIIDGKAIYP